MMLSRPEIEALVGRNKSRDQITGLLLVLTCAHFEAAVVEAASVVVLVSAHQHVGEAGLAHAHRAQDDDTGTGEQVLIVRHTPSSCNNIQQLGVCNYNTSENICNLDTQLSCKWIELLFYN